LEWKLIYVGSSQSPQYDQILDSVLVGPLALGISKFLFAAPPPDPSKIPSNDIVGASAVLLKCFYKKRELIQIGYYINNEYETQELRDQPPEKPLVNNLMRNILHNKPKICEYTTDELDGTRGNNFQVATPLPQVRELESMA